MNLLKNSLKIKIVLIILSLGFYFNTSSQNINNEEFCNEIDNNKIIKDYRKAIELLISKKYKESELLLNKIVTEEENFTEAYVALAEIQYIKYENSSDTRAKDANMSKYKILLEKIVSICPTFENYQLYYILGKLYYNDKKYDKSVHNLNIFTTKIINGEFFDDAKQILEKIEEYNSLITKKVEYNPVLIKNVSSENDEYLPFISPDGTLMFFTRAYMKKDKSSAYLTKFVEEFSVAHSEDDSEINYSKIQEMPLPFNSGRNQGAAAININNSELFITICEYSRSDYNNCDIFYSTRNNNGWSDLKNMGSNINGQFTWESQPSISGDGKTLYFSSIRPENIGFDPNNPTTDIYSSTRNSNGTWSKAKNLGSIINTPGNEKSPFIHTDSQTLYFSSDGHVGIGGYDIFFSKIIDNTFTKPKNIGFPINTENDDIGFVVNTSGSKAYFASNKLKGIGGWDIYSISLFDDIKPEKVVLLKGQISDDEGHSISNAKIDVVKVDNQELTEGIVNQHSGQYAVAIPQKDNNEEYLMVVRKEDYNFTSALVDISKENSDKPITINFDVKPIEAGVSVKLNDIYFSTASFQIDKKSFVVLNNFIIFLNENPKIKIEIRGHTDNIGNLQSNITLSENRAKSVFDYLIKNKVDSARLQYKGYGPNMPIDSNETEAGRAKNRRTEFFILEK
ncbi:MAG: OmpA family protein [Bacteroidales bacterium]|jgi:outer membrane protein OmpA-like peptidoglycan-associated protein|nr:OmpA family protein [Bacteroidales bacterium]